MTSELARAQRLLAEATAIIATVVARDEAGRRAALFARLHALTGGRPFRARAISDAAKRDHALRDALLEAGCAIPSSPHSISCWLSRCARAGVPGGYALERTSHNPITWRIARAQH